MFSEKCKLQENIQIIIYAEFLKLLYTYINTYVAEI